MTVVNSSRDGVAHRKFGRETDSLGLAIGSDVQAVEQVGHVVARVDVENPR